MLSIRKTNAVKDKIALLGLVALFASVIYYFSLNVGFVGYATTVAVTGLCSRSETETQMDRCLPDSDKQEIEIHESQTISQFLVQTDCRERYEESESRMRDNWTEPTATCVPSPSGFSETDDATASMYVIRYGLYGDRALDVLYAEDGAVIAVGPEYE